MAIGKSSYVDVKRKRAIRDEIIPRQKFTTVVGLGGPNLDVYAEEMRRKGFTRLISYELDPDVYRKQIGMMGSIHGIELYLHFGNMVNAPIIKGAFYDVDLCCTVPSAPDIIRKFKTNCTFTFSLGDRRMNKESSKVAFFNLREEQITKRDNIMSTLEFITTDKGIYKLISYKDTSAMLTITKIK